MFVSRIFEHFVVQRHSSIKDCLLKIDANANGLVFVTTSGGVLLGTFTDGDFRRRLLDGSISDITQPVEGFINQKCVSASVDVPKSELAKIFSESISLIPILDSEGVIRAVANKYKSGFHLGSHIVAPEAPAFVVAEIGNNHQGDLDLARRLVDFAVESKADAVKFQHRNMDELYNHEGQKLRSFDLGVEYTIDLLNRYNLSDDDICTIFDYCHQVGITPLCTPWDLSSLAILEEYGLEGYKVSSADMTNHILLERVIRTGKPIFCSTGMSTEYEVQETADLLNENFCEYVLLHCNSTYPTPLKDVRLSYLDRLKKISGGMVGYSGHELGISVAVAAVARGAKVIEKHLTIDKTLEGNDHRVSLTPPEFRLMVDMIREVEDSLGDDSPRKVTQGEMINRENLAKSIVAKESLKRGDYIVRDHLAVCSPGGGLQPLYMDQLVGKVLTRSVPKGGQFYLSDIKGSRVEAANFRFRRPFGIPVRFHDFKKLSSMSNLDFVEFHLTYRDLEIDCAKVFHNQRFDLGVCVHAPELFANDHLLDLAACDEIIRTKSIRALNKVFRKAAHIGEFFNKTERPLVVINPGGFTKDGFIHKRERFKLYRNVERSMDVLDKAAITPVIQTMPPFPWHFGGINHHNLFVDPTEIINFYEATGLRVCLDVSHSQMACNYYGWRLEDFIEAIAPAINHLHISDARGVDGEGVPIGGGDVDFQAVARTLEAYCPDIGFIPEIWQGHTNDGQGFWEALEFLESYL